MEHTGKIRHAHPCQPSQRLYDIVKDITRQRCPCVEHKDSTTLLRTSRDNGARVSNTFDCKHDSSRRHDSTKSFRSTRNILTRGKSLLADAHSYLLSEEPYAEPSHKHIVKRFIDRRPYGGTKNVASSEVLEPRARTVASKVQKHSPSTAWRHLVEQMHAHDLITGSAQTSRLPKATDKTDQRNYRNLLVQSNLRDATLIYGRDTFRRAPVAPT